MSLKGLENKCPVLALEQRCSLVGQNAADLVNTKKILLDEGQELVAKGQLDAAVKNLEKVIQLDPRDLSSVELLMRLARTYSRHGAFYKGKNDTRLKTRRSNFALAAGGEGLIPRSTRSTRVVFSTAALLRRHYLHRAFIFPSYFLHYPGKDNPWLGGELVREFTHALGCPGITADVMPILHNLVCHSPEQ